MKRKEEEAQNSTHLSIDFTPDQLARLSRLPINKKIGGIKLSQATFRAIDLLARSFTGSYRAEFDDEFSEVIRNAWRTVKEQGLDIALVTTYKLPPDLEAELIQNLKSRGAFYQRGEKGLEVFGPHEDRAVGMEALLRSGRISLKENETLVTEKIKIMKR
jgi:hypothetical protein